jgi:hypothetical protein
MAISEQKKQKKLQQKKKKRKLLGKAARSSLASGHKALSYSMFPVHECLVPDGLFETGLGTVIWTRRAPHGSIAISAFIVDVFCLGVKNALFNISSEQEYESTVKPRLTQTHGDQAFHNIHPSCARKLIEGAISYAENLGFSPHRDYQNAKGIFGDIDGRVCPTKFTYGSEGKPFYIRGPNEAISQAKRIVGQLQRKCGKGNFEYFITLDVDDPEFPEA